jgi:hypothetical protein
MLFRNKKINMLFITLLVSGCAINGDKAEHVQLDKKSKQMEVIEVVTPTRVIAKHNWRTFTVDLAYFYPSTVMCSDSPEYCKTLSEATLNKHFWVAREYDRFGLQMHSLWPAEQGPKARTSLNIDLLVFGGYARLADHIELPNGKSELVSRAKDLGFNNDRQKGRLEKLKPWQKEFIEQRNGGEH